VSIALLIPWTGLTGWFRNGWCWRLLHHGRWYSSTYFPPSHGSSVSTLGFCERLRRIRYHKANVGYVQAYVACLPWKTPLTSNRSHRSTRVSLAVRCSWYPLHWWLHSCCQYWHGWSCSSRIPRKLSPVHRIFVRSGFSSDSSSRQYSRHIRC
jgi:hypothetical protein